MSQLNVEGIDSCIKILTVGKNLKKFENDFRVVLMKYTMDHGQLENLAKAVRGEDSFDYSKDFTLQQLAEFYNEKAPKVLNPKFYTVLYNLVPGAGKQIGKGELLLAFMTQLDKSTSKGDLTDVNGENIEVKTDRAKFKGGDSSKLINGPTALKNILSILGEEIKDKSVNTSVLAKLFEHLKNNKEKTEEILKAVMNYNNIEIPEESKKIAEKIKDAKEFFSLALALQAYAYIMDEEIKKVFFLKGVTIENISVMIFNYTNFENLYNFVNSNLRNVGDWTMKAGFSFTFK